jgi:hypothetical protein
MKALSSVVNPTLPKYYNHSWDILELTSTIARTYLTDT